MLISERRVVADGICLAVRDYGGEGRTLVFLHGGPGPNLSSWDGFARSLRQRFHCVAYDQRGHGQSDDARDLSYAALTSDVQAVIDGLELQKPIIVGHSWGGQIALAYGASHPDCAGIIAVDGIVTGEAHDSLTEEDWKRFEAELRGNPVISRVAGFAGTEQDVETLLNELRSIAPSTYPEFSDLGFRRDLKAGSDGRLRYRHSIEQFIALNRSAGAQTAPGLEICAQLRCPVMLVVGRRGLFREEEVEEVRCSNPRIRVEWIDAGHVVQLERPEALEALIADFVAGH